MCFGKKSNSAPPPPPAPSPVANIPLPDEGDQFPADKSLSASTTTSTKQTTSDATGLSIPKV